MPVRVFQNNFSGGELSPAMYSRVDLDKYSTGAELIENGIVQPHGGIVKRGGTRYVGTIPGDGRLIPFSYRVEQTYVLCFTHNHLWIFAEGGLVTDLASPYALAQVWEMSVAQSADVLFIAHPSHRPRTLTRSLVDGQESWAFAYIKFDPELPRPGAPTLTKQGFEGDNKKHLRYRVSAVSSTEEESYPSAITSTSVPNNWTAGATITISWAHISGAVRYNVYKNQRGFYGWIGTVDAPATVGATINFVDDNIAPAADDGPKSKGLDFSAADEHPGVVGIYQQRLVFGRSNKEPQTIWCSQTGALNNFSTSYPLKDTDAIEVAMDSRQMNEIRHLYLLKNQMVVLTAGAEWFMGPGRNSDGITPTNIHFTNQSFYGCSTVPPLQAGDALLMTLNSGRAVRDLYGTYTDEYSGNEVSIMAEHLFTSPIRDWAWQEEPYHTAYAVREDGVMLCFTYMREQNLSAWSRITTAGRYRSVCCIREERADQVYVVVERTIGGESKYFVERMALRRYGDPIEDAFFVDAGLTREGDPAATVSGLTHLAGREVAVLADGGEVHGLTVSEAGTITLPSPAATVQVGLPYAFRVRTLDPALNGAGGATTGLRKNVVNALLRVRETRGVMAGPDEARLAPVKFPPQENWDSAPPLFSGDIPVVLPGAHRREATVYLRQEAPLPATILSLNLTVNSEN